MGDNPHYPSGHPIPRRKGDRGCLLVIVVGLCWPWVVDLLLTGSTVT